MANQYQAVTLTGSAAPLQATLNAAVADINAFQTSLESVVKATASYNSATKESIQVTQRMLDATTKVTETVTTNARGQEKYKNTISIVTDEIKKQEQATRDLARANAEVALRTALPAPTAGTIGQLVAYQNQLNSILNLMSSGKINAQQFNDVLSKATSTNKDFSGFTTGMSQAATGIIGLAKGLKDSNDEADKLDGKGKQAGLSWKNIFNIGEALLFKQALAQITQELVSSIKAAVGLQIQIAQIRTISQDSQSTFSAWNSALTNVSNKLGLDVKDVGAAAYETLSNQTTKGAADTEKFLMTAGEFARTTVSSTKDSVNLLTSAFNAFKIPVEDAEKVAAVFFKTIDLGRIKASELGTSFGRIAQPAAAVGVTLEETAAALTTLTRQGVSAHDAQTQLLNVFTRMLKPTGDLKALMESWGTPTAEAAVATFTFAGVLEKLEKAAHGSSTELANLFPDIRGLRGIGGLTQGGLFDQYQKDLGEIKNAGADYDLAKQIRAEPAADTLIKEFEKVKNFFINDFGQALLNTGKQINTFLDDMSARFKSITGVSNGFGSINEGLQTLTKLGYAAIEMWLVYKTVQIGVTTTTVAYTAIRSLFVASEASKAAAIMASTMAMNAQSAAAGTAATATRGLMAASVAYLPIIAAVGAGLYLLSGQYSSSKQDTQDYAEAVATLTDKIHKQNAVAKESANQKQIQGFKTDNAAIFGPALQNLASGIQAANAELDTLQQKGKEVGESLSESFNRYSDSLKKGVQTYIDKIAESQRSLEKNARANISLQDTIDQIMLKFTRNNATERQQMEIDQATINNMKQKALALGSSQDPKDLEEANRLLKEAAHLEADLAQKRFDIKKRTEENLFNQDLARQSPQAQQRTREMMTVNDVGSKDFNKPILYVNSAQDAAELQKRLNLLKDLGAQIAEKQISIQAAVNANRQKMADDAKSNVEQLIKAYKDLENATPYEKDGKTVKKEYQTSPTDHSLDLDKYNKDIEAKKDKVKENLKTPANNGDLDTRYYTDLYNKQEELFKDLERRKTAFYNQALTERRKADMEDQQLRLKQLSEQRSAAYEKAYNAPTKIRETLGADEGPANDLVKAGKTILEALNKQAPTQGTGPFASVKSTIDRADYEVTKKMIEEQISLMETAKKQFTEGVKAGKPLEELQPLLDQMKGLFENLNNNAKILYQQGENLKGTPTEKRDFEGQFLPGSTDTRLGGVTQSFNTDMASIIKQLDSITKYNAEAAALRASNTSGQGVADFTQATIGKQIVDKFAMDTFSGASPLAKATDELAGKFRVLNSTLEGLKAPVAQNIPPVDQGTGNPFVGPTLPGMNEGGIVGGRPGIDRNLVPLSRGELVIPTDMVPTFLPMFTAMKLGRNPYGAGSSVSTTVGDINITVQGPMTPDKTIRQIGEQLRREVRRGNVLLS